MALTKIDDRGVTYPLDLLDNEKIRFGTGNDLEIYHDGSNNYLKASSGSFFIRGSDLILEDSGGNDYITCSDGGTGGTVTLKHLGSAKLTTAASGISVTGTITSTDSANVADGHVQCLLDSGNGRLKLLNGSDAITVDIQGSAGNVNIIDNGKFQAGSSNDLQIFHDGSHNRIDSANGNIYLRHGTDNAIKTVPNGTVELYYDDDKKLSTDANGVTIGVDGGRLTFNNPDAFSPNLRENAGGLEFWTNNNKRMTLENGGNLLFEDNRKAQFGGGMDLQIYHDGSNSYIDNATGNLYIRSGGNTIVLRAKDDEQSIQCDPNGAVQLFYDNVKKIETGQQYNYVYAIASGNPAGLAVRNTNDGSDYSHAELRLESKNNAAYSSLFTDKANASLRLGYNTTGSTFNVFNDGTVRSAGIKFGSDTAAANTLDDYEESTYTPVLSGTDGWTSTSTTADASYVKIGNVCFVTIAYASDNMAGIGGTAVLRVNLPFTSKASGNNVGQACVSEWSIGSSSISWMGAKVNNNEGYARFQYHNGNNNNTNDLTKDAANNSMNFRCTITYITS